MTDDGTPRTAAGRRAVDWWEGHESFVDSEIEGGFRGAILAIEAEATAAGDAALSLERLDHEETREALTEARALVIPDPAPEVERRQLADNLIDAVEEALGSEMLPGNIHRRLQVAYDDVVTEANR